MAKLTFVGTGLIGGGLAHAAIGRSEQVTVWNRTTAKAEAFAGEGARVAADVAEACRGADRVHVALSDDAAVDAVLEAAGDALRDAVVVDHTTTAPQPTLARARRLAEAGVAYLHAPVFMSPAACRSAAGKMLAAGPRALYERVADGLAAMTGEVVYLGERPDAAAANKLFGNAMIITITAGLADVFALAASLGIEAEEARSLFDTFNPVGTLQYRGAKMAKGDYAASFELPMARKDVRLMIESTDAGYPLTVLPAIAERMDALLERGLEKDDMGVLAIDAVPRAG
jgi:3-hydroxyisobutyrate dehydrogenase-like beta-hydroxyacid dehydrogenase